MASMTATRRQTMQPRPDQPQPALAGWPLHAALDLGALLAPLAGQHGRVMAVFDARYDDIAFPYRPHHYAYLHRKGSATPALYYAVSAALGGVPDRLGNVSRLNNFDTYVFRQVPHAAEYSVMLGNLGRFASAEAQVFAYSGAARVERTVALAPRAHAEVARNRMLKETKTPEFGFSPRFQSHPVLTEESAKGLIALKPNHPGF